MTRPARGDAGWRKSSYSGTDTDCVEVAWRKSTRSGTDQDCVEVAWRKPSLSKNQGACVGVSSLSGAVGVRDSKNMGGPVLSFSSSAWCSFRSALRRGELDLLR
ncbi:hypothetical protein GCM10012275_08780 [Longimycelium tulufanense]|uniref:DUF397 domain-containing protein n=1 Tax=Longimycelium tulufanense TaxID=907463 RepID=A0A8J3FTI1_9PSEU|nr:DUF397 domain-containing protein [Longimycelium tulufanense]GGM40068.1 hypothetical protein GCM10012275_08780 [Longimycelium tulufanense]